MELIVAITGATGAIYGVRLLELLRERGVATSVILTKWAVETLGYETGLSPADVSALADHTYDDEDLAAPISSGSHPCRGMIVAPCSMKTLSGIAHAYDDSLTIRAADVMLKERKKLILLARETPLNLSHIENMRQVTLMGGIIMPPVPSFYAKPQSISDVVDQTLGRVLDVMGVDANGLVRRWGE